MIVFDIIGVLFLVLAAFLFYSAVGRPEQRERMIYSGIGSMMVGVGNIVVPRNMLIGLGMLALGVYVVVTSSKSRA